ncbi:MAG: UvrB/UvrC motif-containing protein [Phycisphaerales bacterium]
MKCDRCDNEATVHELIVKGGKRHERHLCESCAKGEGLPVHGAVPVTQLLTQYITSQAQPAASASAPGRPAQQPQNTCPNCGLGFAQFRQTGLLGCPECYAAFEGQLGPVLARAHDRGTQHKGKLPRRFRNEPSEAPPRARAQRTPAEPRVSPVESAARAKMLRDQLEAAVAAEQYEQAARLRDELLALEKAPTPQQAVRKPATPRGQRAAKPPQPRKPDPEAP